jgi:hypothetical protein
MDEVAFNAPPAEDMDRLKALFDLFAVTLDRLCRIGSGRDEEPGVAL